MLSRFPHFLPSFLINTSQNTVEPPQLQFSRVVLLDEEHPVDDEREFGVIIVNFDVPPVPVCSQTVSQ